MLLAFVAVLPGRRPWLVFAGGQRWLTRRAEVGRSPVGPGHAAGPQHRPEYAAPAKTGTIRDSVGLGFVPTGLGSLGLTDVKARPTVATCS